MYTEALGFKRYELAEMRPGATAQPMTLCARLGAHRPGAPARRHHHGGRAQLDRRRGHDLGPQP